MDYVTVMKMNDYLNGTSWCWHRLNDVEHIISSPWCIGKMNVSHAGCGGSHNLAKLFHISPQRGNDHGALVQISLLKSFTLFCKRG